MLVKSGVILLYVATSVCGLLERPKTYVQIGALFANETEEQRRALRIATNDINNRKGLLPRAVEINFISRNVTSDDPLKALGHACDLIGVGVVTIVTRLSFPTAVTLGYLSENANIPLLQIGYNDCSLSGNPSKFTLSQNPMTEFYVRAVLQYIQLNYIRKVVLIYEYNTDPEVIKEFINQFSKSEIKGGSSVILAVRLKQLPKRFPGDDAKRSAMELKKWFLQLNKKMLFRTIILFAKAEVAVSLILALNWMASQEIPYFRWILTGDYFLSNHMKMLEQSAVNKIAIINQHIDENNPKVHSFVQSWNNDRKLNCPLCPQEKIKASDIPLEAFLLYDGVYHLGVALDKAFHNGTFVIPSSLQCKLGNIEFWPGGNILTKHLKEANSYGLISNISLDKSKCNQNINLQAFEKPFGSRVTFKPNVVWNPTINETVFQKSFHYRNMTLRIATLEEAPFVMIQRNKNATPHFRGFVIDLIEILSKSIGFSVELYEIKGSKYGSKMSNGSWTGLIGDILKEEADIAAAAMVITAGREEVVDFVKLNMDYSVSFAFKKPVTSSNLFSFIFPFNSNVWICIIISFILVVVFIYILNQISPNRNTTWKSGVSTNGHIGIFKVFWFAYGSLMQQGPNLQKNTFPVRIVIGFWWFFTLMVISTYTASLAAFLTSKRMDSSIDSFQDLVKQQDVSYGTVIDSSIYNYIKLKALEANDPSSFYKTMFRFINMTSNHVPEVTKGFERAAAGDFAFLWDVSVIDHEVTNHDTCVLSTVSDTMLNMGYGFAVQQESPLRDALSLGILKLQDSGDMERLRRKWWPGPGKCHQSSDLPHNMGQQTLQSFTGIFLVLMGGLLLACIFAAGEIVAHSLKGKQYPPTSNFLAMDTKEKEKNEKYVNLSTIKEEIIRNLSQQLSKLEEKHFIERGGITPQYAIDKVKCDERSFQSCGQVEQNYQPIKNVKETTIKRNVSIDSKEMVCQEKLQVAHTSHATNRSSIESYCGKRQTRKSERATVPQQDKRFSTSSLFESTASERNHEILFPIQTLPSIFKKSQV